MLNMKQIFKIVKTLELLIVFNTIIYFSLLGITTGVPLLNSPQQYIFETSGTPGSIDPAINYEHFGIGINELIYETLVDYTGNSAKDVEGKLANDWIISSDGLHYTFNLRKNVTFHDGTPFNAYIMKYSLDRVVILNDPNGPARMIQNVVIGGNVIKSMEDVNITDAITFIQGDAFKVIDDYTFQINLEQAYAPFIYILANRVGAAVSPRAIAENSPPCYTSDQSDDFYGMVSLSDWFPDLTDQEIRTKLNLASDWDIDISGVVPSSAGDKDNSHVWMSTHGVGTGPYKLIQLMHFKKNLDWWGTFTKYSPDEFLIQVVDDEQMRLSHLMDGLVDEAVIPVYHASAFINVEDFPLSKELEILSTANQEIQAFNYPSFSLFFFGMNMNDSLSSYIIEDSSSEYVAANFNRYNWGMEKASSNNPFTALNFRKAFVMSFDAISVIRSALNGFAEQMEGCIPNGMLGHHGHLIDEGFYPTYNPTAAIKLFKEVKWKGTIILSVPGGLKFRVRALEQLKDAINNMNIGIKIVIEMVDLPTFLDRWNSKSLVLDSLNWLPDYADPDNYIRGFLHSQDGYFGTRINYTRPSLDNEIEQAANELNSAIREEKYLGIEAMVAGDCPFIYGCQIHRFTVIRDWIHNYEESGSFNPMSYMVNVQHINKYEGDTTEIPTVTSGFDIGILFVVIFIFSLIQRKMK
jgi:ABC-type transport system substrate-binding protein